MKVSEIIKKPVVEAKYLNVDNSDRYRPIIRLFYLNYEKLKYWLYQEEVFEELKEDAYFAEYNIEQCKQDLKTLTEWGNLLAMQDTRRAATLEEFANKKFRYQLSETAVEIERMIIRIENLFIESSSLEPSLLERIRMSLASLPSMLEENDEKLYSYWNDLNNDFKRLNQNYQDYMRELNSVKAENLMRTKEFLVFKDRLIEYLRSFVKGLQTNVGIIEAIIKGFEETMVESLINRIFQYELSIPRLETVVDVEIILDNIKGRFNSIKDWFVSDGSKESEVVKVFDTTNEIIRKITGYAARISESGGSSANRREEYKKLAEIFYECEDINEAHCFAGLVFGTETVLHLKGIGERQTESINSGVYEEKGREETAAICARKLGRETAVSPKEASRKEKNREKAGAEKEKSCFRHGKTGLAGKSKDSSGKREESHFAAGKTEGKNLCQSVPGILRYGDDVCDGRFMLSLHSAADGGEYQNSKNRGRENPLG